MALSLVILGSSGFHAPLSGVASKEATRHAAPKLETAKDLEVLVSHRVERNRAHPRSLLKSLALC